MYVLSILTVASLHTSVHKSLYLLEKKTQYPMHHFTNKPSFQITFKRSRRRLQKSHSGPSKTSPTSLNRSTRTLPLCRRFTVDRIVRPHGASASEVGVRFIVRDVYCRTPIRYTSYNVRRFRRGAVDV